MTDEIWKMGEMMETGYEGPGELLDCQENDDEVEKTEGEAKEGSRESK